MSYPYLYGQYFVALESELEATTRYVECCEENYSNPCRSRKFFTPPQPSPRHRGGSKTFTNDLGLLYNTYSVAYAQIILSAGSEVDVVSKLICNDVQSKNKAKNIDDYIKILHSEYKGLHNLGILIPRYNKLPLTPWDSWVSGKNPDWWKLSNKIKHQRHDFYKEANLKNALFSLSGLFCLVLYYYRQQLRANDLQPWPKLLTIDLELNPRISNDRRPGYILPEFQK